MNYLDFKAVGTGDYIKPAKSKKGNSPHLPTQNQTNGQNITLDYLYKHLLDLEQRLSDLESAPAIPNNVNPASVSSGEMTKIVSIPYYYGFDMGDTKISDIKELTTFASFFSDHKLHDLGNKWTYKLHNISLLDKNELNILQVNMVALVVHISKVTPQQNLDIITEAKKYIISGARRKYLQCLRWDLNRILRLVLATDCSTSHLNNRHNFFLRIYAEMLYNWVYINLNYPRNFDLSNDTIFDFDTLDKFVTRQLFMLMGYRIMYMTKQLSETRLDALDLYTPLKMAVEVHDEYYPRERESSYYDIFKDHRVLEKIKSDGDDDDLAYHSLFSQTFNPIRRIGYPLPIYPSKSLSLVMNTLICKLPLLFSNLYMDDTNSFYKFKDIVEAIFYCAKEDSSNIPFTETHVYLEVIMREYTSIHSYKITPGQMPEDMLYQTTEQRLGWNSEFEEKYLVDVDTEVYNHTREDYGDMCRDDTAIFKDLCEKIDMEIIPHDNYIQLRRKPVQSPQKMTSET